VNRQSVKASFSGFVTVESPDSLLIGHQVCGSHGFGYALAGVRALHEYHPSNMPFAVVYDSFNDASHFALVGNASAMAVVENTSRLLL